ncbi:UDP-2,4-diacetamido-2,4,6-trideoxy-beta-L-altropyranose hydrolase [Spirulina sp. CS-785/01]|uniref:UDP-2,4-diacetamido-2,4, 6-trideoxy-beta-L-altropyranose hydrolase n=1 Tax=Spirulina sp. CS-785/01 TaxID=3021716 RepID=UPI00232EBE4C|nr:UDP-2,4-diacetamido-2,4,6-trideoxy-beta-L-altropyranose hydrolase [Spirulina sp. CS-785/01]MDB9312962.1 UDP-2,4-diacetamido-2,4,6-trideoxy-beta-L-altropyranose hydrolase [Spirulina sp. CS-785/01]
MTYKQLPNLLFRVDASTAMGSGHLMRCLALAQAWQALAGKAIFAVATDIGTLQTRLDIEGIAVYSLSVCSGSVEDSQAVISLAQQLGVSYVVVDGYQFGGDYQQQLKAAGLKVLFIDDYGHADYYCADWVLNQNLSAHEGLYPHREATTQLLLGTGYALLRREFWQWQGWQQECPPVARKILVSLGGGDPENVTLKVMQALSAVQVEGLEVVVVVGGSNPHYSQLADVAKQSCFPMMLKRNVTNMPELMAWADVAVAAGGSTNWELAFMGLPSIILTVAENQSAIAQQLGKMGITISLGWYHQQTVHQLTNTVAELLPALEQRQQMSIRGRKLVDGLGSQRVVEVITGHANHSKSLNDIKL